MRVWHAGYDALGFISCTGTNFLVRSNALREVGGSPTYTLTEDYALGMALKMYGWHCRYVQVRRFLSLLHNRVQTSQRKRSNVST